jgi:hypothetical protein
MTAHSDRIPAHPMSPAQRGEAGSKRKVLVVEDERTSAI